MDKVDITLRRMLNMAPERQVSIIARTDGDPTPHLARLTELGLSVRHKYRLLPGVSVTGKASAVLSLLSESWIVKVEEDRPISTT